MVSPALLPVAFITDRRLEIGEDFLLLESGELRRRLRLRRQLLMHRRLRRLHLTCGRRLPTRRRLTLGDQAHESFVAGLDLGADL